MRKIHKVRFEHKDHDCDLVIPFEYPDGSRAEVTINIGELYDFSYRAITSKRGIAKSGPIIAKRRSGPHDKEREQGGA